MKMFVFKMDKMRRIGSTWFPHSQITK